MIFLSLLSVFAFLSVSEGELSTDLSSVSDSIIKLESFLPDLEAITDDSPNFSRVGYIIKDIKELPESTTPFYNLAALITTSFLVGSSKRGPQSEIDLVNRVREVTMEILEELPAPVTGFDGVPALLVTTIADFESYGMIITDKAYDAVGNIGIYGTDDGSDRERAVRYLIEGLNLIIEAGLESLPDKLKPVFKELEDDLGKFANGTFGLVDKDILERLSKVETAVENYEGNGKEDADGLLAFVNEVLKPLLQDDLTTTTTSTTAARRTTTKKRTTTSKKPSNQPNPPESDEDCGLLLPAVVCLLNRLLGGLVGR